MSEIGIPAPVGDRQQAATDLQTTLVDLVDLSLQGKQGHWNVTGRHFVPVHEQLDALVDDARAFADLVAERRVTLGHAADGRASTVVESSGLDDFPDGFVGDDKVVTLVVDRLEAVVAGIRERIERIGEADPASQDLLIEVLRGLEKHLWMFQAQQVGD